MAASEETNVYPSPSDVIEIEWLSTRTKERVQVESITNDTIKIQYLDNDDIEEHHFDNGILPFEWKLIEKDTPTNNQQIIEATDNNQQYNNEQYTNEQYNNEPHNNEQYNNEQHNNEQYNNEQHNNEQYNEQYNNEQYNNEHHAQYYNNKGNKWQPKSKSNNQYNKMGNNNEYFQPKRQQYDDSQRQNQPETENKKSSKMKRKEIPQQRNIVPTLSAVTTSTNAYPENTNYNESVENNHIEPIDKSRIPLKGDIVEISYSGGSQNDPVRVVHANYYGDARVRYTDAQGADNKINFLKNKDITYTITDSVYHSPDINFIPAPRKGDMIEIRWIESTGGGGDCVTVLDSYAEYTDDYQSQMESNNESESKENDEENEEKKYDINHFDKFKSIWVTVEYLDDKEQEKIDFHPNALNSEILSWCILECGDFAGLDIDVNDIKLDELDNELCAVCCTSFGEFPYRTVVPCAHNNVCAKCTLRMRVFGDFSNDKHPYPMCPFCKESWEIVAFIPLSWTIGINYDYIHNNNDNNNDNNKSQIEFSKYESNVVFKYPLEYDDEIQCYFTDYETLQQFIHIRNLYCLLCNPPNKPITNYNKIYYFHNIGKLLYHLRHEHTSFMCELCLNNARLFMDEQRIFINDKRLLIDHQRNGSPIQEQYGETPPHPFCSLCRQNFYSRESLYEHCENNHCSCHLCKQSGILEYYKHASILQEHQGNLHHLCQHKECLAKLQPVVFDDPVLLKSHQLQVHGWNKPVHSLRTAFWHDDKFVNRPGTMNFSTIFTQDDINDLNINNISNTQQTEEQRLRQRQRRMHRTMDEIKKRWFPNNYKQEQTQRRIASQLGLRHIPDAIPLKLRDEKNLMVIKQIRKRLISQLNFKQFSIISHDYTTNKISTNVFFLRFKNLFEPLCAEKVWVDVLMQMLALLRDGTKRRALYEQYRDWVIGGRVNKGTKIKTPRRMKNNNRNRNNKILKTNVSSNNKIVTKTAASIVAGTYKAPTKEMIMSRRRYQKRVERVSRRQNKNKTVSNTQTQKKVMLSPPNVKGKWKTGAPKIQPVKGNKSMVNKQPKNIPQITSNAPAVKQHWPTLGPAKSAPKSPPKWVDEELKTNTSKKITMSSNINKNNANSDVKLSKIVVSKKTKRGGRKRKKNKQNNGKVEIFKSVNNASKENKNNDKNINKNVNNNNNNNNNKKTQQTMKQQALKMPEKGHMPHEQNRVFNKSNPWGGSTKALPAIQQPIQPTNTKQSNPKPVVNNNKKNGKGKGKQVKNNKRKTWTKIDFPQ